MAGRSLFKRRWLSILIGLLVSLACAIVALVWAMTGEFGRQVASSAINGRDIAGYGELQVEGLRGNVLSEFTADQVTLRDQDGVWLTAQDVRVGWQPRALLGGTIGLETIEIEQLDIARRPIRAERPESSGSGGGLPSLRIQRVAINTLALAENVAGPEAQYTLSGGFDAAGRAFFVTADARRIDQAGDELSLTLTHSNSGDLDGQFEVDAVPGGALASLTRLEDTGWQLTGQIEGTSRAGGGRFDLTIEDASVSDGEVSWERGRWQLQASALPGRWPTLPDGVAELAPDLDVTANGALQPRSIDQLNVQAATFTLDAQDLLAEPWQADLVLTDAGLAQLQTYNLGASAARAQVIATEGQYAVSLTIDQITHPQITAERLSADAVIRAWANGRDIELTGDVAGPRASNAQLAGLVQSDLDFAARLQTTEGLINIETLTASTTHWQLDATGALNTPSMALTGTADLTLDDVAPLGVGVAGPLVINAITRDASRGWDRLTLEVQSDELVASEALTPLLEDLTGQFDVDIDPEYIRLPRAELQTSAIALTGSGELGRSDSAITASLDALLDLAAVPVEGLSGQASAGFEASGTLDDLTLRTQIETGELELGGLVITEPKLRAEARREGDALSGSWQLDAETPQAPARLNGRFSQSPDRAELTVDEASWGSVQAQAEASLAGEQLALNLIAADTAALKSWAADIRFAGPVSSLIDGELEATGSAEAFPITGGDLTAAQLTARGPLSDLALTGAARGLAFEPFAIRTEGRLQLQPELTTLNASLSGDWGDYAINAPDAIALRRTAETLIADLNASLDDADLSGQFEQGEETRLVFNLSNAPARILSDLAKLPPANGEFEASADLRQVEAQWRGGIRLSIADMEPVSGPQGGALNLDARLDLGEAADFTLTANAGGLDANAALSLPGAVTNLGALARPGWRGDVTLVGPLDTLARLYLPRTERFTGVIDGSAQFAEGEVAGSVMISDGAYRSQTAGVEFTPFDLQARFTNDQLEITEARLGDGNGGRATATGALRLTEAGLQGDGEVSFERFRAIARPELFAQTSGNAALELRGRQLTVTGEADIDRLALTPVAPSGSNIPQIEVVELNRPGSLDPAYRRPIEITLDYTVRADNALFVSSRNFNSEWSTHVRVQGPANRLNLTGRASLIDGQASLLTRIFDIEDGEISFTGPIERTRISLRGTHSRAGLDVTALADGPITAPRIRFESSPPLPEDEVLARLLFDQNTAALSPLQAAQLAAQLSGRNWLDALSEAGQRLGIDRLTLSETEDGAIALSGGRQLSEDVYLQLETGTAASLGAARLEWSITPDIVVLSRLTGDTNAQLAVRWRREFE